MSNFHFLNSPIPSTKKRLRERGVSEHAIKHHYWRISHGIYLPNSVKSKVGDTLPLLTRIAAVQFTHPEAVISGIAAAGCWGLRYFLRDAPVTYRIAGNSYTPNPVLKSYPLRIRGASKNLSRIFHIEYEHCNVKAVSVAVAAVDALIEIRKGIVSWWVLDIPGFTRQEVMSIQLLDALFNETLMSVSELRDAAKGRIGRQRLNALLVHCDRGAESPPETLLRLIVSDLAVWKSQVAFCEPAGRFITRADLACQEHKVALFYDGEHHLERGQRDYDSDVAQRLAMQGWKVMRVTMGNLRDPQELRRRVSHLIEN